MISSLIIIICLINLIIVVNIDTISKIINLYDIPDKKLKFHKKKIPLIGGSILIFNVLFLILIEFIFRIKIFVFFQSLSEIFSFLLILFSFFILGFCDDKYKIKPSYKFFFSILISIFYIVTNNNILIKNFSLSIYEHKIFFETFSVLFTIFCIIVLINSLNFFDGINGQLLIFFLLVFSYLLLKTNRYEFYVFIIIIILFCLFLNLRNQIFLGDNGVYVLSVILITSIIYENNIYKNFKYADEIFFLLLLPGIDLIRLTFFRLIKKKNPFYGDRNHIHHLMIKKYSLLITNILLFLLSVFPIFLYNISELNSYAIFSIFLVIYVLLINNLSND
tara:strand:- start:5815 stop:6816 length:1002 start_codon:yes stop_codon:yes gene_type:complete